jgi:hypothetical protein
MGVDMTTFSKLKLSGSTSGLAVKIAATGTPGTALHTAHASDLDEIWLWAFNSDTVERLLTVEFGGVAVPDNNIVLLIPPRVGLIPITPGLILTGSTVTAAFAAIANVITIYGYIHRLTP